MSKKTRNSRKAKQKARRQRAQQPRTNTVSNPKQAPTPPEEKAVIARPMVRLLAALYDGMLILALFFLVATILIVFGTTSVGTSSADAQTLPQWYRHYVMFPSMIATLIWFYGMFWKRSGQTLGMQTWQLQTIRVDGGLLGWKQSISRILAALVVPTLCAFIGKITHGSWQATSISLFVGFVFNYLFALANPKRLAVHDILSRTLTVKIPARQAGLIADIKDKFAKK